MSPYYADEGQSETASGPPGGGCLSVALLPIIAVLFISTCLLLILGNSSVPGNISALAAYTRNDKPDRIAPFFTPEVQYWESRILIWAQKWDLDPNLIATVMQIESCGNPLAHSSAGAAGLFQVMPYHFAENENALAPNTNAKRGLAYLKRSLEIHNGSVRLALAGYNGGISNSKQAEAAWPSETKRYVYWGVNIYQDTHGNKKNSQVLQEWLGSGGRYLCTQAQVSLGLEAP
jgi:hypothetical protein